MLQKMSIMNGQKLQTLKPGSKKSQIGHYEPLNSRNKDSQIIKKDDKNKAMDIKEWNYQFIFLLQSIIQNIPKELCSIIIDYSKYLFDTPLILPGITGSNWNSLTWRE